MIHHPQNLENPGKVPHLFRVEIIVLRQHLEELSNFRLYQKEQIPWFGKALRLVGGL